MTLLELCGRLLRTAGLGRSLCFLECEPGVDCCNAPDLGAVPICGDNYPPDFGCPVCRTEHYASAGQCGQFRQPRSASVEVLDHSEVITSDATDQFGDRRISRQETRYVLNGPNCGIAIGAQCWIRWLIPLARTFTFRETDGDGEVIVDQADLSEGCGVCLLPDCPFTGSGTISEGRYIDPRLLSFWPEVSGPTGFGLGFCGFPVQASTPWFSEWNASVSGNNPSGTTLDDVAMWLRNFVRESRVGGALRTRTTYSGRLWYRSSPTRVEIEYRQQITTRRFAVPGLPDFATQVITKTVNIAVAHGWLLNCDGTNGPRMCVDQPTDCDPDLIGYRIGQPCGAGIGRPVVLPVAFVGTDCGTTRVQGECFLFRRKGPIITDPQAINAIVASGTIGPWSPRTCCACSTTCPKEILSPNRAEWRNGARNLLTGEYIHADPAVAGECCCSAGDVLRLVEGYSKMEFFTDGNTTPYRTEWFNFVDGAREGDFVRGFRRDAADLSYLLNYTDTDGGRFPQQIADMVGPIGCEWRGPFAGLGLAANFNFDRPLFAEGTHVRDNLRFGVPIPFDDPQGSVDLRSSGGWANIVYRVSGGCDGMIFEGVWARGDDLNHPTQLMSAKQTWRIARGTAITGCTGGCDIPLGPTPPDGPTTIDGRPIGSLRDLLGGLI